MNIDKQNITVRRLSDKKKKNKESFDYEE